MPPAISDDESDDVDVDVPDSIPAKKLIPPAPEPVEESDDDDDEEAEDEYQVEKILQHNFKGGKAIYQIKWLGYDSEGDLTWEPIENLSGAKAVLEAYHIEIGGTPEPPAKKGAKKTNKRSAPDSLDTATSAKKKTRKSDTNGNSEWEPPKGSWDDDVVSVAAIIEPEDAEKAGKRTKEPASLEGLLEWKNGKKTQHKMPILRLKCPQRLLDYYEQHLLVKRLEEMADEATP